MDFFLKPSLKQIALIKMTAELWNECGIRYLMSTLSFKDNFKSKWQDIEKKVLKKASYLPLPDRILNQIRGLIKPIGFQILKWVKSHRNNPYHAVKFPNCFNWTLYGTIDKSKTVQSLIQDKRISVTERYKLACIYCLEDDIRRLWIEIPIGHRNFFFEEGGLKYKQQEKLVAIWTCIMKNEMTKLKRLLTRRWRTLCHPPIFDLENDQLTDTHYKHIINYAVYAGNKAASLYFLQKLTPARKEQFLLKCAKAAIEERHNLAGDGSEFPAEESDDLFTPINDHPQNIYYSMPLSRRNIDGIDEDFLSSSDIPTGRSVICADFTITGLDMLEMRRNEAEFLMHCNEDPPSNRPKHHCIIPEGKDSIEFSQDDYSDIFCQLFLQMDKEQQVEMLKHCPHKILVSFLSWPWQSLFKDVSNHMWTFLRKVDFDYLLCYIVNNKIMTECKDFNYERLLCEFWKQSPESHKKYVIEECAGISMLQENPYLILKDTILAK